MQLCSIFVPDDPRTPGQDEFLYYKVTRNFCTNSNFSEADFKYEVFKQGIGSSEVARCSFFDDLFDSSDITPPSDVTTFFSKRYSMD